MLYYLVKHGAWMNEHKLWLKRLRESMSVFGLVGSNLCVQVSQSHKQNKLLLRVPRPAVGSQGCIVSHIEHVSQYSGCSLLRSSPTTTNPRTD